MRKYSLLLLILFFPNIGWSQPLQAKRNHTVIVDTDCAIDDMRALSLMLSRPEINIKAILVSDGSIPPDEGVQKVNSLLNDFSHMKIPVASGDVINGVNPQWRQFNRQITWGNNATVKLSDIKADDCLFEMLGNSDEKIILICLGPLTNIAKVIRKHPGLTSKIERVIWSNESVKPLQGFNYECDKASADFIINSRVRIDVISYLNSSNIVFDSSMYAVCSQSKTQLAHILYSVHSQNPVLDKLKQNHFKLWDELVAVYLTNPELFGINILAGSLNIRYTQNYDPQGIKEVICDMIKGTYVNERNVVFNKFPDQREMFNYDVRKIMDSAISRHGREEWKACVMTDEFHGHLGVFSIVGAKMGTKAREIFSAGPDMLEVVSFAGVRPPYSCLNDGIQVSTGATLGMGTIHISADTVTRPSAIFNFSGKTVRISLRKEYLEKIDNDINEGILKFGLMDDGYWKLIRHNALKYWVEWDRNEIFDIEEITLKK